jgi:hypothetical protein
VKYQCCFDLHFLYGQECWTFLHVYIDHFCFFLWELFICLFIVELVFLSSQYILTIVKCIAIKDFLPFCRLS